MNGSPDWQILELLGKVNTPEAHGKLSDHNKLACVESLTQNSNLEGQGRDKQPASHWTHSLCHHVPQSNTFMAEGGEGV